MNILVLGARAPIAADISKALASGGHSVWAADSLRFPVGRTSESFRGFVRLRPPRGEFEGFCEDLEGVSRKLTLDAIVPVSEEVFWLAQARERLHATVTLRTSEFAVLARLHDKASFAKLANEIGYGAGAYHVLRSPRELAALGDPSQFVFKPVYSRFASRVLLRPSRSALAKLAPSQEEPWLAQRFVPGRELCCYNLAEKGRLLQHIAYLPRVRLGVGASVLFQPVEHPALRRLSESFIAATAFTGQISFDVIESEHGLVALECNPRGTSGAHLAVQDPLRFCHALLGQECPEPSGTAFRPRMLSLPLFLSHPMLAFTREGRLLLKNAEDAMRCAGIGFGAQALAMAELSLQALRRGSSLTRASTADIEWNGERVHG